MASIAAGLANCCSCCNTLLCMVVFVKLELLIGSESRVI